MHFGLLPRANRGIFAINELPDLSGKIQVGLFNIMQEGDVQIKGYPVRLPLDVLHRASPPTPRTTPRAARSSRRSRTVSAPRSSPTIRAPSSSAWRSRAQEAWIDRGAKPVDVPDFVLEVVERVAFEARRGQAGRSPERRQPAPADQRARARHLQRRASGARAQGDDGRRRASPTSTRRCRPSPASSSWNTRENCRAPTPSRAS